MDHNKSLKPSSNRFCVWRTALRFLHKYILGSMISNQYSVLTDRIRIFTGEKTLEKFVPKHDLRLQI